MVQASDNLTPIRALPAPPAASLPTASITGARRRNLTRRWRRALAEKITRTPTDLVGEVLLKIRVTLWDAADLT
jgi:hypothetical protein